MSVADGAYGNLSVSKTLFINNAVIQGKLTIDPSEVHDQNYGVFESKLGDIDYDYVLDVHSSGTYVELYTRSKTNSSIASRIGDECSDSVRFTDMHYEHVIADRFCFRFTSDRSKLHLVEMGDCVKSVILYKRVSHLKKTPEM